MGSVNTVMQQTNLSKESLSFIFWLLYRFLKGIMFINTRLYSPMCVMGDYRYTLFISIVKEFCVFLCNLMIHASYLVNQRISPPNLPCIKAHCVSTCLAYLLNCKISIGSVTLISYFIGRLFWITTETWVKILKQVINCF